MVDKIHIWQFPQTKVSIKLNSEAKNLLFQKALDYFKNFTTLTLFLSNISTKYEKIVTKNLVQYYYHKAKFIPLWVIVALAKKLKINLSYIENSIDCYISYRGKIIISKPILPILVTPEFTAIPVHVMCDGSLSSGKFFYFQRVKENQYKFYEQVKNVFGNYEVKHKFGHYAPKIVADIISEYFKIQNYSTFKCRIPSKIFNKSKMHKVAVLAAHLMDDGTVSGNIHFQSSNKKFLNDIRKIAIILNYKCGKIISYKPKSGSKQKHTSYSFIISAKSVNKFFEDLKGLTKKYPTCDPGYKLDEIRKIVQIEKRSWKQRRKGETKQIILDALSIKPKTAFELRDIASISLWTVYHHLQHLIRNKKVKKLQTNYENRVLYSLNF